MGRAGLTSCIRPSRARSACGSVSVCMAMVVFMAVAVAAGFVVGARFGVEGGLVVFQCGAEAFGQFFQHVVRREAHPAFAVALDADGQLHVAVAQVVAELGQGQARVDESGYYRLVRCFDADDFAGVSLQAVAAAQHRAAVEEQADVVTGVGRGPQAAADAQFQRQREGVVDFRLFHGFDALCQFQHLIIPQNRW